MRSSCSNGQNFSSAPMAPSLEASPVLPHHHVRDCLFTAPLRLLRLALLLWMFWAFSTEPHAAGQVSTAPPLAREHMEEIHAFHNSVFQTCTVLRAGAHTNLVLIERSLFANKVFQNSTWVLGDAARILEQEGPIPAGVNDLDHLSAEFWQSLPASSEYLLYQDRNFVRFPEAQQTNLVTNELGHTATQLDPSVWYPMRTRSKAFPFGQRLAHKVMILESNALENVVLSNHVACGNMPNQARSENILHEVCYDISNHLLVRERIYTDSMLQYERSLVPDGVTNRSLLQIDESRIHQLRLVDASGAPFRPLAGIGVVFSPANRTPPFIVSRVLHSAPASAAGIKPGDVLLSVDGEDLSTHSLSNVVDLLRGEPGTTINLLIRRGDSEAAFTLQRSLLRH